MNSRSPLIVNVTLAASTRLNIGPGRIMSGGAFGEGADDFLSFMTVRKGWPRRTEPQKADARKLTSAMLPVYFRADESSECWLCSLVGGAIFRTASTSSSV